MSLSDAWKAKTRIPFSPICKPRRNINLNAASLRTKDREAVEVSFPNSMHAGQIIRLTKMLTATDLRFYEFDGDVPMRRWYF
jgi:hypothetical protein